MRLQFIVEAKAIELYSENSFILHIMKESLRQYDNELFDSIYNTGLKKTKDYTFTYFTNGFEVDKEKNLLHIKKYILVDVYSCNYSYIFSLYNGLLKYRHGVYKSEYPYTVSKPRILSVHKKIESNEILIKSKQGIFVRNEAGKYITFDHENFKEAFDHTCKNTIRSILNREPFADIVIENIMPTKTIRNHKIHEHTFTYEVSTGIYKITGDSRDLDFLTLVGFGQNRGFGFGKCEVIS